MSKKYYRVNEDRNYAAREELIIADNLDQAYMTYAKQIVKPMSDCGITLERVSRAFADDANAPLSVKQSNKRDFSIKKYLGIPFLYLSSSKKAKKEAKRIKNKKTIIFYLSYTTSRNNLKEFFVEAKSFQDAMDKFSKKKNIDEKWVSIRVAGFLYKKGKKVIK